MVGFPPVHFAAPARSNDCTVALNACDFDPDEEVRLRAGLRVPMYSVGPLPDALDYKVGVRWGFYELEV